MTRSVVPIAPNAVPARIFLGAFLLLTACSVLPPKGHPYDRVFDVELEYLDPNGAIEVPSSGPQLTIYRVEPVEPAELRERFEDGRRYFVPPPACERVLLRCRYRAIAPDRDAGPEDLPEPDQLFPGVSRYRLFE